MHQDLLFSQAKANYSGEDFTYVPFATRGRRGRDRMVVWFTTTYAISAYHNWCCEFESRSGRGVQHYVIMFVSDLRQVGGFLRVDIAEILLKKALNTIKPTNQPFQLHI
jgi:hypothetical protein